jgi:hypothetical protein
MLAAVVGCSAAPAPVDRSTARAASCKPVEPRVVFAPRTLVQARVTDSTWEGGPTLEAFVASCLTEPGSGFTPEHAREHVRAFGRVARGGVTWSSPVLEGWPTSSPGDWRVAARPGGFTLVESGPGGFTRTQLDDHLHAVGPAEVGEPAPAGAPPKDRAQVRVGRRGHEVWVTVRDRSLGGERAIFADGSAVALGAVERSSTCAGLARFELARVAADGTVTSRMRFFAEELFDGEPRLLSDADRRVVLVGHVLASSAPAPACEGGALSPGALPLTATELDARGELGVTTLWNGRALLYGARLAPDGTLFGLLRPIANGEREGDRAGGHPLRLLVAARGAPRSVSLGDDRRLGLEVEIFAGETPGHVEVLVGHAIPMSLEDQRAHCARYGGAPPTVEQVDHATQMWLYDSDLACAEPAPR